MGTLALPFLTLLAGGVAVPDEPSRVIFNCDGHGVFVNAEGDVLRWLENVFAPLEAAGIGTLFWCDGAGGNTANYDSQVLELTGERIGNVSPFLRGLIEEGHDPPAVIVYEAKRRGITVFYSFRINDIHDAFTPEEFPTFKQQHPEWMIGEGYPNVYKTALNFAIPEVRELKLAAIEELFRKYDFDGLEIDFMRGPPFFVPGTEPENTPALTQLLRDVRQHLNARGRERGRPVQLAVRVGESREACRLDGFDVATWLAEGLIDILVLGSGTIDIEVEAFKALAEGSGVAVYPCLYGWPSQYNPIPAALARGLAASYWHQGADGIYLFNWFPHHPDNQYQTDVLRQIGRPDALASESLMFAADRGRPQMAYPHNWLHCVLPAEVKRGGAVEVSVMVGADLAAGGWERLELRSECQGLAPEDRLTIALNGQALAGQAREGDWIICTLPPGSVKQGRNAVALTVEQRAQDEPIVVNAVEIHADRRAP
jgi:hypothetical protein